MRLMCYAVSAADSAEEKPARDFGRMSLLRRTDIWNDLVKGVIVSQSPPSLKRGATALLLAAAKVDPATSAAALNSSPDGWNKLLETLSFVPSDASKAPHEWALPPLCEVTDSLAAAGNASALICTLSRSAAHENV